MNKLAVLITSHNRKDTTLRCLESLFSCDVPNQYSLSIYLVNDGSTDGTSEAIKNLYPTVNIIHGDGNLYWNRGMYLAWEFASKSGDYDFYMWLNDDTSLFTNSLANMLRTSDHFNDSSIIVGSTVIDRESNQLSYGGYDRSGTLIYPNGHPVKCEYFNGNIVLIPREVYEKIGMNDSFYHHSLGDFDYGLRANKMGVNSYVSPHVVGTCEKHHSLPNWCNPSQPFSLRWTAFWSPLGNNPIEHFTFEKRHYGFFKAIFHFMTNHLRVLFPQIWTNK